MPIIKSAKKRVRVARKNTARNVKTKRSLKGALKAFQTALTGKKSGLSKAQSALDIAVKKGVIHKNKAARKKRQLVAAAKKAGVKPAKAVKKTTAKVAPAKKATVKKAAVKKTAVKKPATKKK